MATIRKRKLPSGKIAWQVDYKDVYGKRRHKQFASRRAADSWLVQARSEVADGTHVADRASITVEEAGNAWLAHCQRTGKEATTIIGYRQHVELHINPFAGQRRLSQFTVVDATNFYEALLDNGRSPDMVRRVRISFGALISYAQSKGRAGTNPIKLTPFETTKRDSARPDMPTKEEIQALIAATDNRWRPLLLTCCFTGLRASEVRALTWSDIDLTNAMVTVQKRADRWGRIGLVKSFAGTRDIPIPPLVVSTLRAWKLICPKGDLDLVFPNGIGRVESHANIMNRYFRPTQISAGVTKTVGKDRTIKAKYGLHALRHFCAACWIQADFSAKKIQTLMGHASITQTFDTYGYLFKSRDDDKRKVAEIEVSIMSKTFNA